MAKFLSISPTQESGWEGRREEERGQREKLCMVEVAQALLLKMRPLGACPNAMFFILLLESFWL